MLDYLTKTLKQPEWSKDRLVVHTDVKLSWSDRLRVLLKGRFSMRMDCFTEGEIGRNEGYSIFIAPQLLPHQRGAVYEETASTAAEETTDGA